MNGKNNDRQKHYNSSVNSEMSEMSKWMQEHKIPYLKRIIHVESTKNPYHTPATIEVREAGPFHPFPRGEGWRREKRGIFSPPIYIRDVPGKNGIWHTATAVVEIVTLCKNCGNVFSYHYDVVSQGGDYSVPEESLLARGTRSAISAHKCPKCGYIQRWMRWGIIRNRIGGLLLQTLVTLFLGPGLLSLIVYLIWKPIITFSFLSILSGFFLLAWLVGVSIWGLIMYLFSGAALNTKTIRINPWEGEADGCSALVLGLATFLFATGIISGIGVVVALLVGASVIEGIVFSGILPAVVFPLIVHRL